MLLRRITHLSTWVKFVVQIVLYKVSFHTKFQVIWPTRLGVIVVESFSRDERELPWLKAHKIVFSSELPQLHIGGAGSAAGAIGLQNSSS